MKGLDSTRHYTDRGRSTPIRLRRPSQHTWRDTRLVRRDQNSRVSPWNQVTESRPRPAADPNVSPGAGANPRGQGTVLCHARSPLSTPAPRKRSPGSRSRSDTGAWYRLPRPLVAFDVRSISPYVRAKFELSFQRTFSEARAYSGNPPRSRIPPHIPLLT